MAERKLAVVVSAKVANFRAGMNQVTNQMNRTANHARRSFGPAMDVVGVALTQAAQVGAVAFAALGLASVKGASDLEGYRNTLNVVMKDTQKAAETMAWAVDFANKTPFETASIVEATVKLESYGLKAQEVLPGIGDMAGVMNKDIIQAVEAVADAQTGELERLKEFGITKGMIIEHNNKIAQGVEIVNNQGQIVNQEQFNKALLSLMDERFKGGMEIQATSFKGLMSTIKGVFSTTIATMAGISETGAVKVGGLFDTLKKKMQLVIDKLAEWRKNGQLQEWSNQVQEALSKFFTVAEKVFGFLVNTGKFIAKYWGVIVPILAGVVAGFLAFRTAIAVVNALTIATKLLNGTMRKNPIGLVVLAIGALVTAGVYLYRNWDKIRETGIRVWGELKLFVLRAIDTLLKGYERLWGWVPILGDKIKDAREKMGDLINKEQILVGARAMSSATDESERYAQAQANAAKNARDAGTAAADTGDAVAGLGDKSEKAGAKGKKAAEDTRAAWERTADMAGIRLQILKAQQETAAIGAELHGSKIKALADTIGWLNKQLDKQREIVAAVNEGYQKSVRLKGANAEETEKLRLKLEEEIKAQAELEKEIRTANQAIRDHAKELRDLADDIDKVEKKYREDLVAALEDYERKVSEVNRKLIEDERKLRDEFERTVDDRARSLRDFVGLFDAVTGRDVSGGDLLANLRGQVAAFEDWAKNIQELAARGVDEGLIAELREMGAKAGPEIAALNTLTDDELKEYVALWKSKNEQARKEAQAQLQQQRIEMQQRLQEIRAVAAEQLEAYRLEWEKKNAEIRKNAEEEL
ncbi:MAG: hypothetical protein RDU41_08800, partial [Clostridia bacterium]|nr:hypothetical protein [Clostridia bacterium]